MAHHRPDHPRFQPCGNQNDGQTIEFGIAGVREARGAQLAAQSQAKPGEVHGQFVDRKDRKPDCGKQQQFVLDNREPLQRGIGRPW